MKASEMIEAVQEYGKLETHFFAKFAAELTAEMDRFAGLVQDGSEQGQVYHRGQAHQREAIKAWASMRQSSNTTGQRSAAQGEHNAKS